MAFDLRDASCRLFASLMQDWQTTVSDHKQTVWDTICRLAPGANAPERFTAAFLAAHQAAGRDSVSDWRMLLEHQAVIQALGALRQQPPASADANPAQVLRSQLAQLSDQAALPFCLRYVCGHSFQEIAMELRSPLDDLRSRTSDVSGLLGRKLRDSQPTAVDPQASASQQGDDLLEATVNEIRQTAAPAMPQGLAEQTIAALNAVPAVEFEKPPEPNYVLPVSIGAILVVIVAGLVYGYMVGRPTPPAFGFAQVAEALAKAHSVSYHVARTVRLTDQSIRKVNAAIISVEPGRIRQVLDPPDTIIIWDGGSQKALTLEDSKKRATLRDSSDMFEETRALDALTILKSLPSPDAKPTSQTTIDSHRAQGFELSTSEAKLNVWVDVESHLPVMMEMSFGPSAPSVSALFSDFVWNPAVDDSMLSLVPPEGYELSAIKLNLKPADENDLARALGVASRLNGGKFPDQFDRNGMSELMASLYARLPADKQSVAYRNASETLEADLLQLGRGWLFISEAENGSEWHYAGAGVFYGSDKPVLWYRPAGSRSYRIADASLRFRTIAADRLPDVPSKVLTQATTRPTLHLR